METVTAAQPASREDWLQRRRSGIGASETPVVLGMHPSRLRLYLDKIGALPREEPTEPMQWGLLMEDPIAEMYRRRTGCEYSAEQLCVVHPNMPWMAATLDRATTDGRILEFKAVGPDGPGRHLGEDDEIDTLPESWWAQGHHQMIVAGVAEVTFAVFGPGLRLRTFRMPRNEDLASVITREVRDFWHSNVVARVPPAELVADDARTLTRAFTRQQGDWLLLGHDAAEAADRYHWLGKHIGELQDERDRAKARLLLSLGDAAGADLPGGWSVERKVITVNTKPKEATTQTQVRLYVKEPRQSEGESA